MPLPTTESSEFAKFARRILRAYAGKAAEADEKDLAEMLLMIEEFEALFAMSLEAWLRIDDGMSRRDRTHTWRAIAEGVGMNPQHFRDRWLDRVRAAKKARLARETMERWERAVSAAR